MDQRDNLLGALASLYRWRKSIRNICLLTLVGSIAVSLFLKNYYQATTIFYPASPQLASPELIFGNTAQVTDYFGSDRDLDRLAEVSNSSEVVDFMVNEFRLYEHYDIDSTLKEGPYKVRERFRNLYTAQRNKNDAIEVSIEDTDPKMAAKMANTAREKINAICRRFIKDSQAKLLMAFENNIHRKTIEIAHLGDSLGILQTRYDLYDIGTQGSRLAGDLSQTQSEIIKIKAKLEILDNNPLVPPDTVQYIKANLLAYERARAGLLSEDLKGNSLTVKRFKEGSPLITMVSDLHYQARKQLTYDLERYNQIKAAYNTDIPAILLVEAAETPLIKSRPKRSIIVITAVLAAFLFAALGALIADAYRNVNWKALMAEA